MAKNDSSATAQDKTCPDFQISLEEFEKKWGTDLTTSELTEIFGSEKLPEFIADFCFVPEYRERALDFVFRSFKPKDHEKEGAP